MRYKFLFFILMMVWVSCADEDNPPVSPSETLQNIIVPSHFPEITFPNKIISALTDGHWGKNYFTTRGYLSTRL
ncbi:MAG: hypothetical protein IPL20_17455 [Saprospiraceae bacterium]|nr:hypothetical protein [Saprospiraceae bacterium]